MQIKSIKYIFIKNFSHSSNILFVLFSVNIERQLCKQRQIKICHFHDLIYTSLNKSNKKKLNIKS